eukprot:3403267-Pleurochrysis_carterae.AAC.1
MVEEEGEESEEDVDQKAFEEGLREAGLFEEDSFQSDLMSVSQEKKYTQTRIAAEQHIDDFLNGERLLSKPPHHAQPPEEPPVLELKLALLQLDMIRRNACRAEVKKMRNASDREPWDQVESLFSGPTPTTLA